jgi:hypothetical protein
VLFSAILDVVDLRWPANEGSGTTLNPSIGSVSLTATVDSWVSGNEYNGGVAYDNTDNNYLATDSQIGVNQSQGFMAVWFDNVSTSDSFPGIFVSSGDGTGPTNGFRLFFDGSNLNSVGLRYEDGGTSTEIFRDYTLAQSPSSNHVLLMFAVDGGKGEIWEYDTAGTQIDNNSGSTSNSRGTTTSTNLTIGRAFGDDETTGPIDDITVVEGAIPTASERDEIANNTGPNS